MLNRTAFAGLLLALGAPLWAAPNTAPALREARVMANGGAAVLGVSYDGTSTRSPIDLATSGALQKGGLSVAPKNEAKTPPAFEVPAPKSDKADDSKKGASFFGGLNNTEKISMASGAALGAGAGFMFGGIIGAFAGALIGGFAGFMLSKLL